jgi:uncharacterized membrane protein HdeD (DUF308 family)
MPTVTFFATVAQVLATLLIAYVVEVSSEIRERTSKTFEKQEFKWYSNINLSVLSAIFLGEFGSLVAILAPPMDWHLEAAIALSCLGIVFLSTGALVIRIVIRLDRLEQRSDR